MIAFWIAAFLATAAATALIVLYARRPVPILSDPAQAVYLRQIEEIDDLAARDLIAEEEQRSAKAEAARRVLGEKAVTPEAAESKTSRAIIAATIGGMGVVALVTYLLVGRPDLPDQPYAARFAQWNALPNPTSLPPEEFRKVLEARVAADPQPAIIVILAQLQAQLGDDFSAERSLERAAEIEPANAETWQMLGLLRFRMGGDKMTGDARAALEKGLALNPKAIVPRYLIGNAEIEEGRRAEGLALWRSMLPDLAGDDRATLERDIAAVEGGRTIGSGQAQAAPTDPAIRAMVDGLAARLKTEPNDPVGWARLVRSYAVLQDSAALAGALATARNLFKDRPSDLAAIEAAANVPQ